MKKILSALAAFIFISTSANAFEVFKGSTHKDVTEKIKSFFTYKKPQIVKNDDKAQIKNLLCLLTKYSNEHNIEGVVSLYDKSYRSFDGFDYETFKKMLKDTFEAYDDISYKSNVKNISIYGDKAVVNLLDETNATLTSKKVKEETQKLKADLDAGILKGECNYAVYLKKTDDGWKIIGDNVISETTSIRYGAANNIDMRLIAPLEVKEGSEYCLTFKIDAPEGTKVVASLTNEEIAYPSKEPKEVFRKIPSDGILERVVHTNKNGLNEYAVASLGLTEVDVLDDLSAVRVRMTGMAFLMQRVNMYQEKNPLREVKEETKDEKTKGL